MPASVRPTEPLPAAPEAGVGLYVHWPYCERICPYCDFNVRVARPFDTVEWRKAFRAEMAYIATLRDRDAAGLTSIYFGGGTPSLMSPELVAGIIEDADDIFGLLSDAEISLEANPTSSETSRFESFRDPGVNRLSLGVQAFDDEALRFLGRDHSAADAARALSRARRIFPRTTFDLIYGLPGQSRAAWTATLEDALGHAPAHMSLYQLTIEEGTAFALAHRRGTLRLPDEDTLADLYDIAQNMTEAAGLPSYEVSNHAATQDQGRHNLTYWRYGEYIGIGPGAHGRIVAGGKRFATTCQRDPKGWLATVAREGHGVEERTELDAVACGTELFLMNLRLTEGIPAERFAAVAGRPLADLRSQPRVATMVEDGLLSLSESRLAATKKGRPVLNAVVTDLVAALNW